MRIRWKDKIHPICVMPNDTIALEYKEEYVNSKGEVIGIKRKEKIHCEEIGREMTLDEAVVFDVEPGEFGENVKDGIGGAFLETKV